MKENKFSQFFATLISDPVRYPVVIGPLLTGALGFLFSVLRGKVFSESLSDAGFLFLLLCFTGVVYVVVRRRKLRYAGLIDPALTAFFLKALIVRGNDL